ncbi:exonuclease V [Colossoma macropomum]|uniref:exonuclease V n=1 Tax=Colossoma macropomum TaxID=42526 RepID=UPI001863D4EE|nr:exonuclease V [Colossoma macropomum]
MESQSELGADEWDDISDSELLDIQLDHFSTDESPEPSCSKTDTSENTVNESTITASPSLHRAEEGLEQRTIETDEERGVKRKRNVEGGCSHLLRFMKHHLSVTLLCEQSWCELKVEFGFRNPKVRKNDKQRTEVQTGANIHLARELEVHDVIPVNTQTREDFFAIKLLNMLHMVPILEAGQCVREFPVFGLLEGVFLMGVIDELSYNQKGELVLNELKTRRQDSLPRAAQTLGHCFQVGLYKLLFDRLVRREARREHLVDHLKLRASLVLGAEVQAYAVRIGIQVTSFGELVDTCLMILSCSEVPCIDILQIEYRHQDSSSLIGTMVVPFDEVQLRAELQGYLAYWTGQREPRGVDIEEVWKCKMCPYEEICDWRKNRSQAPETLHTNKRIK